MRPARLRRLVPLCALALVVRLSWPTSQADAERGGVLAERVVPATQDSVGLACEWLDVSETVAARILAALGRPVACAPRSLQPPAPDRAR
jgi:hypothetical protein